MADRLRFLLDRPLDPPAARAVLVFATAILLGFGALFVLGASESAPRPAAGRRGVAAHPRAVRSSGSAQPETDRPATPVLRRRRRRQDPQDKQGSPAAARAVKALRSHRALQHAPYRHGHLSVRLVGAHDGRAVLAVSAPTISAARRGWRRFLRRYHDAGRSYIPRFTSSKAGGADG
jgi:hypothetical protein